MANHSSDAHSSLPRPFYDQWPRKLRPSAHALWHWHSALTNPQPLGRNGTETVIETFFEEEKNRAEAGEPLRLVREEVCQRAYTACDEHDLDRSLLALQVAGAKQLYGEQTRFETSAALKEFVGRWAVPHGQLLAMLAGTDLSIHLQYAGELARGFFHLARLISLPRDVAQGRLFIPMESLRQRDVTIDQLREGTVDEGVRGLLWKESVRIRDALAQGRPLIANLSLRQRFALTRFWVGALELLKELERRDFDLWSRPLDLSFFRRVQVYVQTLLGRSASR